MANRFTGLAKGSIASRIIEELGNGPCTLRELKEALPDEPFVKEKLTSLRGSKHTRRIRIESWVEEPRGGRTYVVAVYALGKKRDAKKPPPRGRAANQRAYVARKNTRPPSSVFDIALRNC